MQFADVDAIRNYAKTIGSINPPSEDDSKRMCNSLIETLSKNVCLRQWLLMFSRGPVRNTEGWMALGEKLSVVYGVASGDISFLSGQYSAFNSKWSERLRLSLQLLMADTYLWSSEVNAIVRASPLPAHVIGRELMAAPYMFWSEETAYDVDGVSPDGEPLAPGSEMNWQFLSDAATGINIFGDVTNDGKVNIYTAGIKYGCRFPEDLKPIHVKPQERWLQRLAFLKSPFVETRDAHAPRAWRRETNRIATSGTIDSPVRVVVLRRDAARQIAAERAGKTVDWKHQWWVSGHYRAQYYPSKQAHEVIWIAPHLKGPEGAPMQERVYAVKR